MRPREPEVDRSFRALNKAVIHVRRLGNLYTIRAHCICSIPFYALNAAVKTRYFTFELLLKKKPSNYLRGFV
jgi:hypothetical protein